MRRVAVLAIVTLVMIGAALAGLRHLARSRTTQLFGTIVAHVPTEDSIVALTFDDGPLAGVVDSLLAALGTRDVRATFFVTGAELTRAPAAGRALVAAGHELGNHSYSHRRLVLVSPRTVAREIGETDELIRAAGQQQPIYFRPPYGYKLFVLPRYLARSHRTTVTWDVEPDSYPDVAATSAGIVAHILERVRPGSIILLHPWYASRATSRAALPTVIDSLHARGYRVTTVRDLLNARPALYQVASPMQISRPTDRPEP